MRFRDIPQFISDGSYQVNMSWEYLIEWLDQRVKEEGLQLNPDFQRGHVWTDGYTSYLVYRMLGIFDIPVVIWPEDERSK